MERTEQGKGGWLHRPALKCFLLLCPWLLTQSLPAQDTLRIGLKQADSLLLARNLDLVAAHFEIDKAEAARVQARLFNNPQVSSEWSVRPDRGSLLDVGPHGQKVVAVEELFRIAGQRGLGIKEAIARKRMSEAQYAEFAAAVRARLHGDLYRQYYLLRAITSLSSQLELLKGVAEAYSVQFDKGNVSLKEATRLRASYFELNDQRVLLEQELNGLATELRTLLADDRAVLFVPSASELRLTPDLPNDTAQLVRSALGNRGALVAAQADLEAKSLDVKLQRRSNVPDFSLGGVYDQNGSYLPNYTAFTAGFSLPILDRGQGRIRLARATEDQSRAQLFSVQRLVRQQVLRAVADITLLREQYTSTSTGFDDQLDQLSEGLIGNYIKRNISLLEFTDLFESYTAAIIRVNTLKADLQNAYEQLEFATGTALIPR